MSGVLTFPNPVGLYVETVSSAGTAAGTTITWTDFVTISLSPGDWDVTGTVLLDGNGAAVTNTAAMAVSLFSGATTTDHVLGNNYLTFAIAVALGVSRSATVSNYRLVVTAQTTVYLKSFVNYSLGTPLLYGRLSARRVA
jgi:hypothetical protein